MIEKAFPFRLVYKLVFARRAGGQVVRKICVVVLSLTRSVSFYGLTNWEFVELFGKWYAGRCRMRQGLPCVRGAVSEAD